ncbi:MAG: aldo/keto reductase [Halobacteriaceae archaeon]
MEYTTFGKTGLEVSRLCLGCGGLSYSDEWEWSVGDRERSRAIVEAALDRGINFIDTANVYSYGESEEIVGEAIDGRRDEVVIASKVGQRLGDGPNRNGLSKSHIIEQCERSLDRLDTDHLDLYYAHWWDPDTDVAETLSAFDYLIEEGMVRYVGASNLTSWQLMDALRTSERHDYERYVAVQPEYSLVARHQELDLLPAAERENLGVATYAPLAAGFLTGEYTRDSDAAALESGSEETYRDLSEYATEANFDVVDAVRDIADREGVHPVAVSVAWVLEQDAVDAPIVGPQSIDHLDTYCDALTVDLSPEDVDRLAEPVEAAYTHADLPRTVR